MSKKEKNIKGVTAEKDEFSEWFTQIMLKADLADYTDVSGAMVFKPHAYAMWEKLQKETDTRFKKIGIQNVYFPLFIPEKSLKKEQVHVEGFSPEVAWVTHAGNTKLNERLAVRPTSEAIMYESYAKWIRSWRDLPLKYNQWNNVVRWEFKHPVPFLRSREFLWNEGHTAYATQREAESEGPKILNAYKEVCEQFLALPGLLGKKTDKEKFAGAEYTISIEYFMPNGKAIQGPDFHHDGQNFAKAYGIQFLNKKGKKEYAWQNTWAISTRMLGVMFAVHSDSKGLVLPPRMAPKQVVIVPIIFEDSKKNVLKETAKIEKELKSVGAFVDGREEQSPGFKFNEWELKGVPLRIEIGPKDLSKKQVIIVRRDTGEKKNVAMKDVKKRVNEMLDQIQENLFNKAKKLLDDSIMESSTLNEVKKVIQDKKLAFAPLCNRRECEDQLKFDTGGAKVLNIPEKQPKKLGNCIICDKSADYTGYVGKSY